MATEKPSSTEESSGAEESTSGSGRPGMSLQRRGMLAGTAGFASVALAGCAGEEEPTDAPTAEPTEEPTEEPTDTPEPQPENYVVTDDVIAGSEYVPEGAGGFAQACAPQRQFVPGMQPVFDVGVWDPDTGDAVGPDTIDEATVEIDGAETVELSWSEEDQYWGGSWIIPEDWETGTVTYSVEITNSGEYHNYGVVENEFQVIEFDDPKNYVVSDDLRTDHPPEGAKFVSDCGPSRAFVPGMKVIMEFAIHDGTTGEPVAPTDFEYEGVVSEIESTTLTLDGPNVSAEPPLEWQGGGEGDDNEGEDFYWQATWVVPEDAGPGTVTYSLELDTDAQYREIGVLANEFDILESA
ncbi:MAG: hypothetical protein V5A46_06515 [Haloferacaceae archaeon]